MDLVRRWNWDPDLIPGRSPMIAGYLAASASYTCYTATARRQADQWTKVKRRSCSCPSTELAFKSQLQFSHSYSHWIMSISLHARSPPYLLHILAHMRGNVHEVVT